MKIIVGLGNPGQEYAGTRHNAGAMLAEALASSLGAPLKDARGFRKTETKIGRIPAVIATLPTFMNESGKAVKSLLKALKTRPTQLIILVDDFQIPVGRIRLRPGGSTGGHKGMESILTAFSTEEIARLRIGIGRAADDPAPPSERWSDYVLTPFTPKEKPVLQKALERGVEALKCWVSEGTEKAMCKYNG